MALTAASLPGLALTPLGRAGRAATSPVQRLGAWCVVSRFLRVFRGAHYERRDLVVRQGATAPSLPAVRDLRTDSIIIPDTRPLPVYTRGEAFGEAPGLYP